MSNDNSKKKELSKDLSAEARKVLKEMGVDPDMIRRETSHELMVPKMALIGVFETTLRFCEAGKSSIIANSGQALNVKQLRSFIQALDASVGLAEQILAEYELTQVAMTAKDTLDFLTRDSARKKLTAPKEADTEVLEAYDPDDVEDITEEELTRLDEELKAALAEAQKAIKEEKVSGKKEEKSGDSFETALKTFKTKGKLSN